MPEVDASIKPALRRTCTDLQKDPGLKPLTVEWNRAINAKLRRISPEEASTYEQYIADGIGAQFTVGSLANNYAPKLRQRAALFMIDFNIKTRKGILHRSVRLSHCHVVPAHSTAVLELLSHMQAGLMESETDHAIPFPARCTLSKACFQHGVREKRASSGLLQINLAVEDPLRSIKSAFITGMHYPFGVDDAQRRRFIAEFWTVDALLPATNRDRSALVKQGIPLAKVDHLEAFPESLKQRGTVTDIANWLGPASPSGTHLANFVLIDIKRNMAGDVLSARLKRVGGPAVPTLECDAPPVAAKKTSRFSRR
jgi:hypothetical protein